MGNPTGQTSQLDVTIIGGGLNGGLTALLLARDGHRVTILEPDPTPPPQVRVDAPLTRTSLVPYATCSRSSWTLTASCDVAAVLTVDRTTVLQRRVRLLVMPIVSAIERRTGAERGSASVVADSKQLLLCSYLSAVLLAGLVINSTLGWSWADPVAGLLIAGLAVREGRNALRGDVCYAPPAALLSDSTDRCCS